VSAGKDSAAGESEPQRGGTRKGPWFRKITEIGEGVHSGVSMLQVMIHVVREGSICPRGHPNLPRKKLRVLNERKTPLSE